MIIARILGTVVSTQKDERLKGSKLLLVRPLNLDGSDGSGYVVAVDTVGAGFHERVLVVAGSSARLAEGQKDKPVDAAIIGVIDRSGTNVAIVGTVRGGWEVQAFVAKKWSGDTEMGAKIMKTW